MPKVKTPDSSLVSYVWPENTYHYNVRDHAIDTLLIHHAANGEGCNKGYADNTLSVIFSSCGARGSCQYGIDSNGKIGQMLNEKYRSWCSDSRTFDMRGVTVECANCEGKPNYAISNKAMASLIKLSADICRRNGKSKLVWISDANKAKAYEPKAVEMKIILHKWLAATPCPGPYLESKMAYIANEVNKILGSAPTPSFEPYLIKVTYNPYINIRSGPGVNYKDVGDVPCGGVYTIVEEKVNGSQTWGRLKSGAGWICLTGYTKKV